LKHREHQQTQLTVIANLCPSFAVGMCGQSPERGNGPALTWKGTIVKKLLVSTLVAASLASAPPAHAGNYDGLLVGGIIAGGLIAAAAAAAANHPHVVYQQGPTRVIYKRAPTRVIYAAAPRHAPAPRKAAVVAPPAHHSGPAWTDLHQGAAGH
jgi:hypothetical protein